MKYAYPFFTSLWSIAEKKLRKSSHDVSVAHGHISIPHTGKCIMSAFKDNLFAISWSSERELVTVMPHNSINNK